MTTEEIMFIAKTSGGGGGGSTDAVIAFSGQDVPVGSIKAKKGDIYRDTNTNKLYMCTQYVDPAKITDLTGLDVILRSKVTPLPKSFSLNFTCNGRTETLLYTNSYSKRICATVDSRIVAIPDGDTYLLQSPYTLIWTNINGTDASNPEFVDWVKENASSIIGVGSQWVETPNISALEAEIDDLKLFKFPNATIVGSPKIDNGQISNFSDSNYLQFPFIVDVKNRPFEIDFCFTTGTDVNTQQNILDSEFGLALAVKSGKGVMSMSSNGTSWDIGSVTGTKAIATNTTYYAKLTWNGSAYKTALSTDGIDYTTDMTINSTLPLFPRTIFIGGSYGLFGSGTAHPFKGSINLNKATLSINDLVVWSGMDDAGLSTRADVSLSNIDDAGKQVIKDTGIKTLTGSGIPVGSLDAKVGDFYRDVNTNKLYQCSTYNTIDNLNDLSGITVTFTDEYMDRFRSTYYVNFTCPDSSDIYSYIYGVSSSAPVAYPCYIHNSITNTNVKIASGSSSSVSERNYRWHFNAPYNVMHFIDGADIKNTDFIDWIKQNAKDITGLGSQWVEVGVPTSSIESLIDEKLGVIENGTY